MKILVCADIHADPDALKQIIDRSKRDDIELVVCAGDISIFESYMKYCLRRLNSIKKPVLMIPGNHETPKDLEKLCKKYKHIKYIHKKLWMYNNYVFIGYGTGGFAIYDKQFKNLTQKWKKQIPKSKKIVLVVHAPAFNTKLDKIGKNHVGNKDIRNAIISLKPILTVCGHIHETAFKEDKIKGNRIINPGWYGKVVKV